MVLKCEICKKKFKRPEDVFTHPYSFLRPKLVHRECIHPTIMLFYGAGPFIPMTTSVEMAVPSVIFLIFLFGFFLSLIPISLMFYIFIVIFILVLYLRLHFIKYYLEAQKQFEE